MRISPYGLVVLAILGISTPMLAFAEIENEANEGAPENGIQAEHESGEGSPGFAGSGLVLMVTIVAIVAVVGYSAWKVYKIRRRAASKSLV